MNVKFKKLALSAGITAALGGFSMPSHAIIEAAPGEALLVPFVVYNDGVIGGTTPINTIVELTVPGSVGHDTIPNFYTASHTSPTNPGAKFAPATRRLLGRVVVQQLFLQVTSIGISSIARVSIC